MPYVVVLQHDLIDETRGLLVAPLVSGTGGTSRLYPIFTVEGRDVTLFVTEIAAIPRALLPEPVTNLAQERHRIVAAIDYLLGGV